jgi:hypothetical protein
MSDDKELSDAQKANIGLHKPIDEDLTEDELGALRERIARHWKMSELPHMDDLQCLRVAETIVQGICIGMNSNQLDEFRILKYVNIGVLMTMNLRHGGRGVALRMFIDEAMKGASEHLPIEDRTGDTGGAPTIWGSTWDWEKIKMPDFLPYSDHHKLQDPMTELMKRVKNAEKEADKLRAEVERLKNGDVESSGDRGRIN